MVEFTQSAKGVWYCTRLKVYDENLSDAINDSDKYMQEIEKILRVRNGLEDAETGQSK